MSEITNLYTVKRSNQPLFKNTPQKISDNVHPDDRRVPACFTSVESARELVLNAKNLFTVYDSFDFSYEIFRDGVLVGESGVSENKGVRVSQMLLNDVLSLTQHDVNGTGKDFTETFQIIDVTPDVPWSLQWFQDGYPAGKVTKDIKRHIEYIKDNWDDYAASQNTGNTCIVGTRYDLESLLSCKVVNVDFDVATLVDDGNIGNIYDCWELRVVELGGINDKLCGGLD